MAARTLIIVNSGDPSRVEMTEFSDPHEAQTFVEELLAGGTAQEQIRAFTAEELDMQVSHRPVVSFGGGAPQGQPQAAAPAQAQASVQPLADDGAAPQAADGEETPMVRDGVRFSSLFKPDGGLEPA